MMNISKRVNILKILSQVFIVFIFVVVLFSSFGVKISLGAVECKVDEKAGETEYCLLEPIFTEQYGKPVTLSSYLSKIYQAFFITAGLLATLMLILGGFQYMISESGGSKGKATEQMRNAVWGLLLALSSYLILYTINPDLLKGSFKLTPIPIQTGTGGVVEGPDGIDTRGGDIPNGTKWPDDSAERALFEAAGFSFNNPNCKTAGEKNCTSVYQIGSRALPGLKELKALCKCNIMITGGTEFGHKTHGIGKSIVDIDNGYSALDGVIEKGTRADSLSCGLKSAPKYVVNGVAGIYVDEGNHWHVCY